MDADAFPLPLCTEIPSPENKRLVSLSRPFRSDKRAFLCGGDLSNIYQKRIKHNNRLSRTMKLPFAKDDDTKRMMSGTSNGRNEIIYEAREMSVTGNAVPKCGSISRYTQIESNMDLGSGDTTDFSLDVSNHRGEEKNYSLTISEPIIPETRSYDTHTAIPLYERFPSVRFEAERLSQGIQSDDDYFKGQSNELFHKSSENLNHMDGNRNSTYAIVEDNHQPSFKSRESNPSIPSPNEHSKTSTLRISDRTRSEHEDDIEKADDAEQDRSIMRHDGGLKTSATTNEKLPDLEKSEKNGNWQENPVNDADTDCAVQCLYYTIECCECTIL